MNKNLSIFLLLKLLFVWGTTSRGEIIGSSPLSTGAVVTLSRVPHPEWEALGHQIYTYEIRLESKGAASRLIGRVRSGDLSQPMQRTTGIASISPAFEEGQSVAVMLKGLFELNYYHVVFSIDSGASTIGQIKRLRTWSDNLASAPILTGLYKMTFPKPLGGKLVHEWQSLDEGVTWQLDGEPYNKVDTIGEDGNAVVTHYVTFDPDGKERLVPIDQLPGLKGASPAQADSKMTKLPSNTTSKDSAPSLVNASKAYEAAEQQWIWGGILFVFAVIMFILKRVFARQREG